MLKAAFRRLIKPYLTLLKKEMKNNRGFLPPPTHTAETPGAFYMGWTGTGLIRRQSKSDNSSADFTSANFAKDWANRENIEYK